MLALLWYLHHRKAHTFDDSLAGVAFAILLVYYQFSYFDSALLGVGRPVRRHVWAQRPRDATRALTPSSCRVWSSSGACTTGTVLGSHQSPVSSCGCLASGGA